jgi:hypothetical protein
MSNLIQKIEKLSREQALEASGFVSEALVMNTEGGDTEKTVLKPLIDKPYQNIEEIEQLSRLVLISAALTPEYENTVRKAVEGAGKKSFIMGGAEIVTLAVIALGALHVIVSKGKASETETIEIQEKKDIDGNIVTTATIKKQKTYGIGLNLASVLKSYFGQKMTP